MNLQHCVLATFLYCMVLTLWQTLSNQIPNLLFRAEHPSINDGMLCYNGTNCLRLCSIVQYKYNNTPLKLTFLLNETVESRTPSWFLVIAVGPGANGNTIFALWSGKRAVLHDKHKSSHRVFTLNIYGWVIYRLRICRTFVLNSCL